MTDKYLYIDPENNNLEERDPTVISSGSKNAGDIVSLDDSGKFDISLIPEIPVSVIVGEADIIIQAAEDLLAGDFVGTILDEGISKARKASSVKDGPLDAYIFAVGFVKKDTLLGEDADIFQSGKNVHLTGLTIGVDYFIDSIPGKVTSVATSTPLESVQKLGRATSDDTIFVDIGVPIIRS